MELIIKLLLSTNLVYPAKPNKRPPTPVKPLAISDHFIVPNFSTLFANNIKAVPNIIIPVELIIKLLLSTNLVYPAKLNKRPPTPVKPLANEFHFISPIFLTATTNKFIANAKLIMFELPLKLPPSNVLDNIVTIVIRAAIPKAPLSKPFESISLRVFIEFANVAKDIEKINNPFDLIPKENLVAIANTDNIAPIPYIAFFRLGISTLERPTKAAAIIPIAIAIFINALALRLLCHVFNVSPSASNVSVIDFPNPLNTPKLSPTFSIHSDIDLKNLDIFFINMPLKKVFKTSKKSILDILFDKALPNFAKASFKDVNISIILLPIVTVLSPF